MEIERRLHFVLIMRATARRVALIARSNAAEADHVVVIVVVAVVSLFFLMSGLDFSAIGTTRILLRGE